MAESFEAGAEIVRALAQGPGLPEVDPASPTRRRRRERWRSRGRAASAAASSTATSGVRGRRGGALVIVGFEGDEESVARRRALTVRALRGGGAAYLGQAAGRAWEHGRYQGPYLRDTLMGMGAMVETLETSHTWSRFGELHDGGRQRDPRRAGGAGHARPRLLPPLPRLRRRRLALLHLHLPRPPRRRDRAVGGGQARRLRGDRRPRRHDHPPPRRRPRPRPVHGGRGGEDGTGRTARRQGAARSAPGS